jgi:hypothetical protein
VENYLHVSKQAVGKFALGLRTTGFRTTIPNTVLQGCKLLSDIRQCPTKFGKCPSKSNFDCVMLVFVRPNSSYVRPKLKMIGQMSCQVKYLFAALVLGRSRKDPHSPHRGNFLRPEREGRKNYF